MKQTELKRNTSLSRGPGPKRKKARRRAAKEREQMRAFFEAGMAQWCAGCGGHHGYAAVHHVVYRQHCPPGKEWDARNAMAVCDDCHERHHNASRRIPLAALSETHWEFAREVLGEAADDYLRRRYADG